MVDIEWHVFQWTKGVESFYGEGQHPLLWAAGSAIARGKIKSDGRHRLVYACGLQIHAVNKPAR